MENQHRKIKGYRELSQREIDLMNRIKEKGAELLALSGDLAKHLEQSCSEKMLAANGSTAPDSPEHQEYLRFCDAEPFKWQQVGKTDIETGLMALVRAVAQPGR